MKCRLCDQRWPDRTALNRDDEDVLHAHLRDAHADYYADWEEDEKPWNWVDCPECGRRGVHNFECSQWPDNFSSSSQVNYVDITYKER